MDREIALYVLTLVAFFGTFVLAFLVVVAAAVVLEAIHSVIDRYRAHLHAKRVAAATARADAQFWAEVRAELSDKEIARAAHLRPGEIVISGARKLQ